MTGSAALDILIGLFTLYFVMSTLSSAIVELIGNILALRAKMLKSFLDLQFATIDDNTQEAASESKSKSTITTMNAEEFYKVQNAAPPNTVETMRWKEKILSSINSSNFAQSLNVLIGLTNNVNADFSTLKDLVKDLPPSPIKDVLINAIQQSDQTLVDVSTRVAKWFDGEMERLSDLYKRRAQFFLFFTGLVVAIFLNVNTVDITDALAKNPSLREAVLEQTKSIVGATDPNKLSLDDALDKLSDLSLPIGWNSQCPIVVDDPAKVDPLCPPSTGNLLVTLLGILITAAAVALGAPFWFDLLKALTTRASGTNKEDAAKNTATKQ